MRICFLGTPDFALPSLKALIDSKQHEVVAVFTQPDKPVGRKKIITPPPVKTMAEEFSIPVFQPEKIRESQWVEKLKEIAPDLMITAAFGQILSQEVLDIPSKGTVNVHGSLLPKYRGPAPIQWSIVNGEKVTGITTMMTDAGIDTGDMLLQREVVIGENETAGELFDRLADIGADILIETLTKLDEIKPVKQNEKDASYFPMITKEMARIDFNKSCFEIFSLIKGMNPWPVAWFELENKMIKVYEAVPVPELNGQPGEVLCCSPKGGVIIGTGEGCIKFTTLQSPGKKTMCCRDFANGVKIPTGEIL